MALDTAQQRGSAIGISLPWRSWTAVPDSFLEHSDRLSLAYYAAAFIGDVTQADGYRVPPGPPHYRIDDDRPHYLLGDNRPHYRVIE